MAVRKLGTTDKVSREITKSEKLSGKIGQNVECSICHKESPFNSQWLMKKNKSIVCPKCITSVQQSGELLVSIL